MNQFKVSGPEVFAQTITVRCCRDWEVVETTTTINDHGQIKNEYWWWRNCGYCGTKPMRVRD